MKENKLYPIAQALIAALLFGASAPVAKILLGETSPVPLAAFLYLGSGAGLLIYQSLLKFRNKQAAKEAPLVRGDFPWLLGAILFGGVAAPILLMTSLKTTPASTASLLLNFESIATTVIAVLFFKEGIGKRVFNAILCVTLSSILLSWDFTNHWGISLGALGILCACFCWGIDNNFTRNISAKNPITIVIMKGLVAGSFSLILAIALGDALPGVAAAGKIMLLGCFSYGVSIVLFVLAMRSLGSARTSALFGTSPFIGAALSFLLLGDVPGNMFLISLPIMLLGTILLLKEDHVHRHIHESIVHEHRHCHGDFHHEHHHATGEVPLSGYHSHLHEHRMEIHEHAHTPDIHHRHIHE